MSRWEVFVGGGKLLGLVSFLHAFLAIPGILSAFRLKTLTGDAASSQIPFFLSPSLTIIFYAVFGIVLTFYTEKIADFFTLDYEASPRPATRSIFIAAGKLLGFLVLFRSLRYIIIAMSTASMAGKFSMAGLLVAQHLFMIIGLLWFSAYLMFFTDRLADGLRLADGPREEDQHKALLRVGIVLVSTYILLEAIPGFLSTGFLMISTWITDFEWRDFPMGFLRDGLVSALALVAMLNSSRFSSLLMPNSSKSSPEEQ